MFGISFVSYPLMSICWRPGPRRPTSNFYILIRSRSSGGTDENAQSILNGRHILGMNRSIPRFCNLDLINDQTGVVSVIVTSKSTINLRETKKNRVWKASNNPSTSKIFSCVVNHKKNWTFGHIPMPFTICYFITRIHLCVYYLFYSFTPPMNSIRKHLTNSSASNFFVNKWARKWHL